MPIWTEAMNQTYEFYMVDPISWKDTHKIDNVIGADIKRDLNTEIIENASIQMKELTGEFYVRIYLVTTQNKVTESFPLGTFLVQTPSSTFTGKVNNITVDSYSPLLELKEKIPPIGYYVPKSSNILSYAYDIISDAIRPPVVYTGDITKVLHDDFIASGYESFLEFTIDMLSVADYSLALDDVGRIIFTPNQDIESLAPLYEYNDGNSSILYPEITVNHDLYGIPNVVEVTYSDGAQHYYAKVKNDNPNSPTSIQSRGREILYRVDKPELIGDPTDEKINDYAEKLLKELSSVEYTVTYTHAYCGTRIGDCVLLNYKRAGLENIKAKIISQNIECKLGCPVTETAAFNTNMWR